MGRTERQNNQLRDVKITTGYTTYANGSVLIEFGNTKVICTAIIENKVPGWMKDQGSGWATAEYGMLPGSSQHRIERKKNLDAGRTKEIARLIGRTIRSVLDLKKLGERTVTIDCDVIQADGGTRTTSINGGILALALALVDLRKKGEISESPLKNLIAAVSVGILGDEVYLDLQYDEDSAAKVDMNVAMLSDGTFAEIQGSAEHQTFSRNQLTEMLDMAKQGINEIIDLQKNILGSELQWLLGNKKEPDHTDC